MKQALSSSLFILTLLAVACSKGKKDDDNPGGGGGGGAVAVTSLSPNYVVWGEPLTIKGTGFSSTKTENFVWLKGDGSCNTGYDDSTGWRKAEVVSASATQLVVKVPWTVIPQSDLPCGHTWAKVRVIVNGKMGESADVVNCVGWPVPVGFCYWYGGAYYAQGAMRVGDSVMMEYGGFAVSNLALSGNLQKVRLQVDGNPVPITYRPGVSGCDSRAFTFALDANKFGDASTCEPKDSYWGGTGKKRSFKFYIENVPQSEFAREYWVFSLPKAVYSGVTGATTWSKSAGGTPEWTVTGRNMFYNKARFSAQQPCTGTAETLTTCTNQFCDQFKFGIPLSLLNGGCVYTVSLVDVCGASKIIGSIKIDP